MSALVLDTNIVLDLLLFQNPQVQGLRQALDQQQLRWLATVPMREELVRVLAYPKIALVLARLGHSVAPLLAQWDAGVSLVEVAPRCAVRCRDPNDQMFIDLAVAHRAQLLSKDALVLRLTKRLLPLGVVVSSILG
ncbi:MAG: putative toxin-antitoxin system toxin component, PIN family [Betaproteobacteria bacterium]